MKETDLYMTAALFSFVSACIAAMATLTGPHWLTGAIAVGLFSFMFVFTFRLGIAADRPRPRKLSTMEINLARFQAARA